MKTHCLIASLTFFIGQVFSITTYAQTEFIGTTIVPSNPTSMDSITFVRTFETVPGGGGCSRPSYKSIAMVNNIITITFSEGTGFGPPSIPTPNPLPIGFSDNLDAIDLGKLPPGEYTLNTINPPCLGQTTETSSAKFQFKVTDARLKKGSSDPTIDFSGHWWDENDSGWGLFIWQDAAGNTMAAWFTYTSDGKPAWYVFQPTWASRNSTVSADIWQTSKPPGSSSPPTGTTKLVTVGKAALGFYFGNYSRGSDPTTVEQFASFRYSFGDGAIQTRTLKRFKAK
jgi:hypothetical protein